MPQTVHPDPDSITKAANELRASGIVAFPTETVYGLGARTFNEAALTSVYELKGRPADNPLIAHVLDAGQSQALLAPDAWDDRCERLASLYWPGPLTLVLKKSHRVGARATAGRPTIAIRSPAHRVARALIAAVGEPLSAPSANRSGRISPTTAQHVMDEFADVPEAKDLLILDGGACSVGIESTVLDLSAPSSQPARVLRHGSITIESLRDVIGEVDAPDFNTQAHSPGTRSSHYAPRTPMELHAIDELRIALDVHARAGRRCIVLCFDPDPVAMPHVAVKMPTDGEAYARTLYQRLREADACGFDQIMVVQPPATSHTWRAIHDRLRRAAAKTSLKS